jgi:hypothetical protein
MLACPQRPDKTITAKNISGIIVIIAFIIVPFKTKEKLARGFIYYACGSYSLIY